MGTLAEQKAKAECCARLDRLDPNRSPRWGRMTAHQMVCHLSDSFRAATGEKPVSTAAGPLPRKLIKWIALRTPLRWARNVKTRPEMEQGRGGTPPGNWEQDRETLRQLIASFDSRPLVKTHPIFGR